MDPSWCPGCDRLILPKRYIIPVNPLPAPTPAPTYHPPAQPPTFTSSSSDPEHDPKHPPPPPAPTPVPSSPEVRKKPLQGQQEAHANRVRRAHAYGGGLVHGTGRVRPGGGLKPRPPQVLEQQPAKRFNHPPSKPAQQQPKIVAAAAAPPAATGPVRPDIVAALGNPTAAQTQVPGVDSRILPAVLPPAAPKKTRVVISQDPTPLYCSDECRARDLKNSYIESESAGFAGAQAAIHRLAQLELVIESVERSMKSRRTSTSPDSRSTLGPSTPNDEVFPFFSSPDRLSTVEEPHLPPVPPNSLVDTPPPLLRTGSMSSASSTSASVASSSHVRPSESTRSTIRAATSKARPRLPASSSSFPTWGSLSKAALAPPARTLLNASSSSLESSVSSVGSVSSSSVLFDDDAIIITEKADSDTSGTTPSRRGSDSSGASNKKKQKRVSFASDSKPGTAVDSAEADPKDRSAANHSPSNDWRPRRRRNPLLEANPLRDAVSVSPKDRVKASSLPNDLAPPVFSAKASHSTPSLCPKVVDTPSPYRTQRYRVAMWPEDEKRTTESARVHGELLREYAKRFGPREGRSLVWGPLLEGNEDILHRTSSMSPEKQNHQHQHEGSCGHQHTDSRREYWRQFEEREAETRARRKAEAAVQRSEEERVICELLGGAGMREEDQPQARRMKQMAYDGMPGPAELRGLTYKFDRFLYPLMPPKPTIVEKVVKKWDDERHEWVDEVICEEVFERKKLFNFLED